MIIIYFQVMILSDIANKIGRKVISDEEDASLIVDYKQHQVIKVNHKTLSSKLYVMLGSIMSSSFTCLLISHWAHNAGEWTSYFNKTYSKY